MVRPRVALAATALVTLTLVGCAQPGPGAPDGTQRQALLAHHWSLQQAQTAQGTPDAQWVGARPLQLDFSAEQAVFVQGLCNTLRGRYTLDGRSIEVGRLAATMMACSDNALMQRERQVGQQLPQVRQWQVSGTDQPLLQLRFADGAQWTFAGQRTHESLYGAPQQIFLEVAPQTVACNHPLQPQARCLRVRELRYDEAGLKRSVGDWQNYHGEIEGYRHRAGVREVLRLKRYTRPNPPADASRFIDVLDLRVETENVG
jgi:heat shock protein HslJ